MFYRINMSRNRTPSMLESWDGIVIRATPVFKWAIEKDIGSVLWWVESKGGRWTLVDHASPGLTGLPTDHDISSKTKS